MPQEIKLQDIENAVKTAVTPLSDRVAAIETTLTEVQKVDRKWIPGIIDATNKPDVTITKDEQDKVPKGIRFARFIKSIAAAKHSMQPVESVMKEIYPADNFLHKTTIEAKQKALAAGTGAAGGFLVPETLATEVIELLRAQAVVRKAGARSIPMVTIPKFTAGATAAYVGENTNITKTESTFGQIVPTPKKLAALIPVSNDLIRRAAVEADQLVLEDAVASIATVEDIAFIRYDASQNKPKGLLNWINSANKFNANGTINVANVTKDLVKSMRLVLSADVKEVKAAWLFSYRTWAYLFSAVDANSNPVWKPEMEKGTLYGRPFYLTSQIPENLGAGSDESEIYFGEFTNAMIAENAEERLIVDVSQEAAYHDGSSIISPFSQDQTVIRVLSIHDFLLRYDKAFSVMQAVKLA